LRQIPPFVRGGVRGQLLLYRKEDHRDGDRQGNCGNEVSGATAVFGSSPCGLSSCPYCRHQHYHVAKPSPYRDIRVANCGQRHLKKKLRGKPLFYRLQRMRARRTTGRAR